MLRSHSRVRQLASTVDATLSEERREGVLYKDEDQAGPPTPASRRLRNRVGWFLVCAVIALPIGTLIYLHIF